MSFSRTTVGVLGALAMLAGSWMTVAQADAEKGSWGEIITWPHVAVSAAAMPDGKIATWAAYKVDEFRDNKAGPFTHGAIFDPATGVPAIRNNTQHDMFCSGISQLADGSYLLSGGNSNTATSSILGQDTHDWSLTDTMNTGRWYGTSVTLQNGDVMQSIAKKERAIIPEVWRAGQGWTELPGASMDTYKVEQDLVNNTKIPEEDRGHKVTDAQWYAFLHLAPDGRVFQSGPTKTMHWFDTNGVGSITPAGTRNGETRHRQFGSAAMYDEGMILLSGGADTSLTQSGTASAMTIDISGTAPVIQAVPDMIAPRTNHDSIVLPNGEVLVVGGETKGTLFTDANAVLTAEIWNPDSRNWRPMAALNEARNYHSVALLMRDGRVLAAGGGLCGGCTANHLTGEIFTPPYLFDVSGGLRDRPVILGHADEAQAGSGIEVTTDGPVSRFTMVRLSGVTHSINTDQRFVELDKELIIDNRYRLTLPSNPAVLIPGNYWLYALDANGTPSIGEPILINVGVAPPNTPPVLTKPATQTITVGTSVSLQLNASDADGDTLIYSVNNLPDGLVLDTATGKITGQVTRDQRLETTATVSDGQLTDEVKFLWVIGQPQATGTELKPGDVINTTVAATQWKRYIIAPSGAARTIRVTVSEHTNDIDLYVHKGAEPTAATYTCRPYSAGTAEELCSVIQGANETLYIGVNGYQASSPFKIAIEESASQLKTVLTVNKKVNDSISGGDWHYYTVSNPENLPNLMVVLRRLTSDLDLYIKYGERPTKNNYDCRSYRGGTLKERCVLPQAEVAGAVIGIHGPADSRYRIKIGGGTTPTQAATLADRDDELIDVSSLNVGQNITKSVGKHAWWYYRVDNGTPGDTVVVKLNKLSADADLYVRHGFQPTLEEHDCKSLASNKLNELCTVSIGQEPVWIGVYGYQASDFTLNLSDHGTSPTITTGGQRSATIEQGEWHFYRVANSSGVELAEATLSDISGDADLYTRVDGFPSLTHFDCRSYQAGNATEQCAANVSKTSAIIGVYGYFSGRYTLRVGSTPSTRSGPPAKLEKGIDAKVASDVRAFSGSLDWATLVFAALVLTRRRLRSGRRVH